jgi:hypothetical protein
MLRCLIWLNACGIRIADVNGWLFFQGMSFSSTVDLSIGYIHIDSSRSGICVIRFICTPFYDGFGKHILQEEVREGHLSALPFLKKGLTTKSDPDKEGGRLLLQPATSFYSSYFNALSRAW